MGMRQNGGVPKLELARPALRMLICAISFDASPLFPDVRGRITRDLLKALDTTKWQFEGRELFVMNDEAKRYVSCEPDSVMLIIEEPPADPEGLSSECVEIANLVLAQIEVDQLSTFAMNLDWRIGVQKGDKLSAWLHDFFGMHAANQFFDAFGGKPRETEAKFAFAPQKDVVVAADVKVLDAEEAADESFFKVEASDFPDESIQLDLWRLEDPDEQFPLDELGSRWIDSYSRMLKMSERAGSALTEQS
jgi:hypothetical protein